MPRADKPFAESRTIVGLARRTWTRFEAALSVSGLNKREAFELLVAACLASKEAPRWGGRVEDPRRLKPSFKIRMTRQTVEDLKRLAAKWQFNKADAPALVLEHCGADFHGAFALGIKAKAPNKRRSESVE